MSNISVDICQSASNSNKPSCLTNGTTCLVLLDGSSNEVDNGVYNCTSASSNTSGAAITAMRTAINTTSNWTTNDATAQTLPPSGCSPLPVTWVYFTVGFMPYGARLEWGTASETNCSHFEIQRSYDAINWTSVQNVSGGGTKYRPTSYFYDDYFDAADYNYVYYRIKQVDYNHYFEFTPIKTAARSKVVGYTAFEFHGNPFSASSTLKTFLPTDGETHIEILDASGNPVFDRVYYYHGGYNRFNPALDAPSVMSKPGFYFLRASIEGETKIFKLIVR